LITARPLPLKWVLVYKFDKDGFLEKHKARIVVRGDLQFNILDKTDIYAHTLAIQHFRTLMAIVAVFDLEADAMDVVGAFLNANVNGNVYCYMLQGFEVKFSNSRKHCTNFVNLRSSGMINLRVLCVD
jgi:hypothetical protein